MLHKLKMLFVLVPIFLSMGCGDGNDPIFQNLDGNGKFIYIGIILGLGLIGLVIQLIFKKNKTNKQTGSSSQPQPTAQQITQQQTLAPPPPTVQQSSMPQQSAMPPLPSNEMVNELSKTEPPIEEQKETA